MFVFEYASKWAWTVLKTAIDLYRAGHSPNALFFWFQNERKMKLSSYRYIDLRPNCTGPHLSSTGSRLKCYSRKF